MPPSDFVDSWFQMFSSGFTKPLAINLPGSGSIGGFTYQPNTVWEAPSLYRGNFSLEQSIYGNVASPGKQLGKLMDAVLLIAEVLGKDLKDQKQIKELSDIAEMIERLKDPVVKNVEQTAREDLEKLLATNKSSLKGLIDEFQEKLKDSA
ncbi:MAG: hypothetical protein ABW049_02695 [Spongiibacteraceae bacterium]